MTSCTACARGWWKTHSLIVKQQREAGDAREAGIHLAPHLQLLFQRVFKRLDARRVGPRALRGRRRARNEEEVEERARESESEGRRPAGGAPRT